MGTAQRFAFPKSVRILRRSEFQEVYSGGVRRSFPSFTAFCLRRPAEQASRVGITAPRALGKAVKRNRAKRVMREAIRKHLGELAPGWLIVFNPKKAIFTAPHTQIEEQVQRLFQLCSEG